MYLFAESRADGAVAVLSEAHLDGDVQGHGVLFLGEKLDDGDCLLNGLVRAGKNSEMSTGAGEKVSGWA